MYRFILGMLGVTTDENWKDFAKHLGFTKREIKDKLGSTNDPFALIMGVFQARGGMSYYMRLYFVVPQYNALCW